VERVGARSVHLLTPHNHGHAAWAYQSSHGGGMVGADDVSLSVHVAAGSTLFLSSQGASRIHARSRSRFTLSAQVESAATLISWPDPLACFPGATFTQEQTFSLRGDANLLLIDAWSAGRVARGERWDAAWIRSRTRIAVDQTPIFHDALELNRDHGALRLRVGGEALATVVLVGPALAKATEQVLQQVRALPPSPTTLIVASPWPWGLVLRVVAPRPELLTQALRRLLQTHLAELLGEDPLSRKW
jgi:urease accessory protein